MSHVIFVEVSMVSMPTSSRFNWRIPTMQGQEIDRNRIGMHVQNREFKITGFLTIQVFGSQELEGHKNAKKHGQIKSNHKKMYGYNAIMLLSLSLVLHEQEFEKEDKWILNFLRFFFQRDTKGTNPTIFLCSIPLNPMHEQQYHRKLSSSYVFPSLFLSSIGDSSRQA